jgi:parallel beta-helix repeat protein
MNIVARSLAVLLSLLCATAASAADYYVKNGGNDGNDGLSVATAWATLQHAADGVDPGDTVHVLPGSFPGFYLDRSGAPGSPITFVADGPGVAITANNPVTPDGINLEAASHVVIDGFTVDDRTRTGIRAVLAEFVTIRNCSAGYNGKWGILTGFVDDVVIENNVMHHSVAEHGIYVSNSGDRPIIRNNLVHDNHANGIHMNGDLSQGGDGVISQALVENNVIHGNGAGGGSGINMDGVTDSVVRNNLVFDHHSSGVSLYRIDGATGSTNNLVVNNTFITAADGRWAVNISGGSTGNTVLNNVLYTFHSFRGAISIDAASRPGFVSDYNSVMDRFSIDGGNTRIGLAAWQALGYDAHSFLAVPADHFVDPDSDFHLQASSPALDAGTATDAPPTDLEGTARPLGAGFDVGAYEFESASCGDGAAGAGEECDAAGANGTDGSCCTAACQFKPNGAASCDGNACTRPDTCADGACTPGACAGGAACTICGGTCNDTAGGCECAF